MKCVVFSLLVFAAAQSYALNQTVMAPIPIPKRWPGVLLQGDLNSKVKMEVCVSWVCPACVRSWPHLKQVAAHYEPSKLAIVINPFALPYQRNARLISQALYTARDKAPTKINSFVDHFFANWQKFTNAATFERSDEEIVLAISELAEKATSVPRTVYQSDIHRQFNNARSMWKFASRKGVAGAPWYFVNDIDLVARSSMTFDKWKAILDPLVK